MHLGRPCAAHGQPERLRALRGARVRQFSPTSNIVIPAWMKAGSDDGHREWVKSDAVQQGLRDGTYAPMSEV